MPFLSATGIATDSKPEAPVMPCPALSEGAALPICAMFSAICVESKSCRSSAVFSTCGF